MAHKGKIDEQDPQNLYPAVNPDPSFAERVGRGINMDLPNASGQGTIDAVKAAAMMTLPGQTFQAGQAMVSAASNLRDARQPYKAPQPTAAPPSNMPVVRNAADVLPAVIPNAAPARNYLAEVEAKDRMFNAERDTPAQTPNQAAYTPDIRAIRTNPWKESPPVDTTIPVYQMLRADAQAGKYPDSMQTLSDHEKGMVGQIKAMLPGASPKDVRHVMNTITQTVKPQGQDGQAGQPAGPQSMAGAVNAASADKPNYQKLGAGQSIYQMMPDGTAKHMTTAPGGAAEKGADAKFNNKQKSSIALWAPIKKEYNAKWDKITENIPDGNEREKALRGLNAEHFRSLGVPEDLAEVPVSFKSYLSDAMAKEPAGTKITREQKDQLEIRHRQYNKLRNRLLEQKFGNTLEFSETNPKESK